jgi:GR25 family glycosyltransferase involved in LPS biosynthesis
MVMDGYYINLEHRTDRKQHIENMISRIPFFENIKRMEAIPNKRGDIGCSLSHIKCLNDLLAKNKEYYLIIEDDFFILNDANFNRFVDEFEQIKYMDNWDVITLTPRGDTNINNYILNFNRIENNQTASGYIIKHRFIETLLTYFNNGVSGLIQNGDPNIYALDQCWKPLQRTSNFIYYKHIFAGQLPGQSDIEHKYVDYNARFIKQNQY